MRPRSKAFLLSHVNKSSQQLVAVLCLNAARPLHDSIQNAVRCFLSSLVPKSLASAGIGGVSALVVFSSRYYDSSPDASQPSSRNANNFPQSPSAQRRYDNVQFHLVPCEALPTPPSHSSPRIPLSTRVSGLRKNGSFGPARPRSTTHLAAFSFGA